MAEQPRRAARKRRTRGHVIADLAVNHLEYHVLMCGYTLERITHDYSIDCVIFTYTETGDYESGGILVQVKASDQIRTVAAGSMTAFTLDRRDIAGWLVEPLPVVVVVYDAKAGIAWWLYVQSYFARLPGFDRGKVEGTATVRILKTQLLNSHAVRRFSQFRDAATRQTRGVTHHDH
jgi:hypothetical protein